MKTSTILGATLAALAKHFIFPDTLLLVIMGFLIVVDFLTGVLKAVVIKEKITSRGFSRTITKFLQYGGCILVGIILSGLAHQRDLKQLAGITDWLVDGSVIFIIYIEIVSVLENIHEVDKKSPISKYIIKPLYQLLTFQLKNNPLIKANKSNSEGQASEN